MIIQPPESDEYQAYYGRYIARVPYPDLMKGLKEVHLETENLLSGVKPALLAYRYDLGKWTIKEIIGHLIDTERILSYRALRFARGDKTPVPGFEENDYARHSNADQREISILLRELKAVRDATIYLFSSFDEDMICQRGVANQHEISVRALGYIIVGHEIHHREIIKERYLQ